MPYLTILSSINRSADVFVIACALLCNCWRISPQLGIDNNHVKKRSIRSLLSLVMKAHFACIWWKYNYKFIKNKLFVNSCQFFLTFYPSRNYNLSRINNFSLTDKWRNTLRGTTIPINTIYVVYLHKKKKKVFFWFWFLWIAILRLFVNGGKASRSYRTLVLFPLNVLQVLVLLFPEPRWKKGFD